ncbi:hypothetical protein AYI70_g676 [Smittium culicis]|uniref:EXPERA domain-containing protein n=1 Tax=Smittium culicis TaxID=133412 RepID=A0A1R1YGB0_9FUNG|nr:hypothetical protein AYI70_g676 [Smittium culicis]
MLRPATKNLSHLSWFHSLLVFELLFQVPLLILILLTLSNTPNSFGLAFNGTLHKSRNLLQVIYGTHTATTMIPVLGYIYSVAHTAPIANQITLVLMYLPFSILPLIMAIVSSLKLLKQLDLKTPSSKFE